MLQDKEQEAIVEKVRSEYLDTLQRNAAGRTLSHRARSHLKQACLAAATNKVLLEEAPVSSPPAPVRVGIAEPDLLGQGCGDVRLLCFCRVLLRLAWCGSGCCLQ